MADMESLYNALRNADAAGDTEGAKRLAQYIQQVQTAAPVEAPPKTTALGHAKELAKGVVPGASLRNERPRHGRGFPRHS